MRIYLVEWFVRTPGPHTYDRGRKAHRDAGDAEAHFADLVAIAEAAVVRADAEAAAGRHDECKRVRLVQHIELHAADTIALGPDLVIALLDDGWLASPGPARAHARDDQRQTWVQVRRICRHWRPTAMSDTGDRP